MSIANTQAETIINVGIIDDNDQVQARVEHLKELETLVGNSYPNKYERSQVSGAEDTISNLSQFAPIVEIVKELKENTPTGEKPNPELKEKLNAKLKDFGSVKISGRLTTTPRTMGKAAFVHLSDGVNRLQVYVRRDDIKGVANDGKQTEVNGWDLFKLLDGGDFVGVGGFLFLTNTGELSIHVETIQFLSKALLPMPDKMHGIADPELRRRYRYADLIASSLQVEREEGELTTREVFERRAKLISGMRRFLDDAGFIEVETPMLTPKATGAAAKPFETHHNALDIPLYARIAPELYLKRLTVGGFEKVYELNRNFRNEGLSQKHNPEFTMLEFYCAYMDVNGMMDFAEAMIQEAVKKATGGSLQVKYGENDIDFSKFERISMKEAIIKSFPIDRMKSFKPEWLEDELHIMALAMFSNPQFAYANDGLHKLDIDGTQEFLPMSEKELNKLPIIQFDSLSAEPHFFDLEELWSNYFNLQKERYDNGSCQPQVGIDNQIEKIFENMVEKKLIQPTFIIDYPKSISPLSKASPENPNIAERFELFINGMECANGFSELNDPQEQYERFVDQGKEREGGDEEAMVLDEDYIRALSYGMPPAAGIGIGIDRLVMLLTNKHSIRDVILFPHMRPERKQDEQETETPPVNPS